MKILVIALAIVISSCAFTAIPLDKPFADDQCFESRFNPHRFNFERWVLVAKAGNTRFFKNPNKGQRPPVVAVVIHPYNGMLVCYAYMEGKDVATYKYDFKTKCYVVDNAKPETIEWLKLNLLNVAKELQI